MPLKWSTPSAERGALVSTAWFALALLAVLGLLVALAGILRWDPAREWLESEWSLTFPTLLPSAAWSWLALAPVILLLLYFLKLRRRPLEVSSTLLWRKSIEDLHVNSLFQWLRKNLLLIVQLLVLGALGYALAGPTHNREAQGRHLIFILDNSASMSATDVKPNRLEEAKRRLREHIAAMSDTDHAMLIAFNSEAAIVQSFTTRKPDLLTAVDRVPTTQRTTRLEQALALAEGQANPRRSTIEGSMEDAPAGQMARSLLPPEGLRAEAIIFSDGRFPDVPNFNAGKLQLRFETIGTLPKPATGSGPRNVAITMASLRRDERRPEQFRVEVRAQSYLTEPLQGQVSLLLEVLTSAGRVDRQSKPIDLLARTQEVTPDDTEEQKLGQILPGNSAPNPIETFHINDPGQGWVRITLVDRRTGTEWKDDLDLDNRAWLAIAPVRRARVLRIGPPNDILEAFLRACSERQQANVVSLPAAGFEQTQAYLDATKAEQNDLVIFDRVQPSRPDLMPQANTFFVGSAPPWAGGGSFDDLPWLANLFVKEFRTAHPLLRGIETLQGMTIGQAKALPPAALPARASALIETQSVPVLWALGRERYTDLVLTFPLLQERAAAGGSAQQVWNTNWPKQPPGTLPLFLHNVVTQLGRFQETEEGTRPGQVKNFSPGVPVERAVVRQMEPAAGPPVELKRLAGRDLSWNAPEAVGLYDVEWGDKEPFRFAVNLFDPQESCLDPRPVARLGEDKLAATAEPLRLHRELWPWLAGAAVVLLLVEWMLYLRRVAV